MSSEPIVGYKRSAPDATRMAPPTTTAINQSYRLQTYKRECRPTLGSSASLFAAAKDDAAATCFVAALLQATPVIQAGLARTQIYYISK